MTVEALASLRDFAQRYGREHGPLVYGDKPAADHLLWVEDGDARGLMLRLALMVGAGPNAAPFWEAAVSYHPWVAVCRAKGCAKACCRHPREWPAPKIKEAVRLIGDALMGLGEGPMGVLTTPMAIRASRTLTREELADVRR